MRIKKFFIFIGYEILTLGIIAGFVFVANEYPVQLSTGLMILIFISLPLLFAISD